MSVLYSNSRIFCNTCVHFQWKKTNACRHDRDAVSAGACVDLHDKRHLLAKLRICASENCCCPIWADMWFGLASSLSVKRMASKLLVCWTWLLPVCRYIGITETFFKNFFADWNECWSKSKNMHERHMSSVESQKGAIAIKKCSIENQKGVITIDFVQW